MRRVRGGLGQRGRLLHYLRGRGRRRRQEGSLGRNLVHNAHCDSPHRDIWHLPPLILHGRREALRARPCKACFSGHHPAIIREPGRARQETHAPKAQGEQVPHYRNRLHADCVVILLLLLHRVALGFPRNPRGFQSLQRRRHQPPRPCVRGRGHILLRHGPLQGLRDGSDLRHHGDSLRGSHRPSPQATRPRPRPRERASDHRAVR
mmetsp:Transcript_25973/g.82803  ORF Transcript_25973/g.82803 Transcript_25973/m.82803 type:complete len:206 (-) Transcript_25973:2586-3203(-)